MIGFGPAYYLSATEAGWVRRRDLGSNVWELPDGRLWRHYDDSEPTIERRDILKFQETTNGKSEEDHTGR